MFLLGTSGLQAQVSQIAIADKDYEKLAYVDAIKTFEKVADKGYKSIELFGKLGNAYYFQSKYEQANRWYSELFAMNKEVDSDYYIRYAQTLKSIGDYKKADEMMAIFYRKTGTDSRGVIANSQKDYLSIIKKKSGRFTFGNAGINSEYSDYGSSFYKNKLVFTSARDTGFVSSKKHSWDNQSYTNLYCAEVDNKGGFAKPEKFSKSVSSKYNESTPVFTKDGATMYFTRNNYLNGKKGKSDDQTILIKLYKATKEGDKWVNVVALPFNSDNYNVAHPALSPDEKTLYFASDMPGTNGQSDIFKVSINDNGGFGTPENLGNKINTGGRETFPFISDLNELYFASDGHPGLGGLDVFVTQLKADGVVGVVKNVGEPVNSKMDDFAFLIDTNTKNGFVSSNRKDDNLGYDDIYKFTEITPIEPDCEQQLIGVVADIDTRNPIANAIVKLYDTKGGLLNEIRSDANGKYAFDRIDCEANFIVRAQVEKYSVNEVAVKVANSSGVTSSEVLLQLIEKPVKVGDDLRFVLGIDIIYFDLGKSNIITDAAVELSKIVDVMTQYPNMCIDVRSHSDCRQTAKYNIDLSERRAKSTIAWLVKNGIEKQRLTGRGYGESRLLNNCACEPTNDSNCSEELHQKNRRSEFIIVKL